MSSVVNTIPDKERKTTLQAQIDMGKLLQNYTPSDGDFSDTDRGNGAGHQPRTPASRKIKKPAARKNNQSTPKSAGRTSSKESPSVRKSERIKNGAPRTPKARVSDEGSPQPKTTIGTKRSAKVLDPDETNEQPSSAKKQKTITTPGRPTTTESRTTKRTSVAKPANPATIQQRTGRFVPINSLISRAKKIEKKRSAEPDDDTEATIRPPKRSKKNHATKASNPAQLINSTLDTTVEDADEANAAEDTPTKPKRKGKGKGKGKGQGKDKDKGKETAEDGLKGFKGTSNGNGSSVEQPENANATAWKCANRNCSTGQTWHNRNKFGRKTKSHIFGRNKKATSFIHPEVWHIFCRKDYQRGKYAADEMGDAESCRHSINIIDMQLDRIQIWRKEAKFKVQLSKQANDRMNKYFRVIDKNKTDGLDDVQAKANAILATTKTPRINHKSKKAVALPPADAFPIDKMLEFEQFVVSDCNFDHLKGILHWIRDEVNNGRIKTIPPMEFLINKQGDDEEVTDPNMNYEYWTALEDRTNANAAQAEETAVAEAGPSDTTYDDDETGVASSETVGPSTQQADPEGTIPDFESYQASDDEEEDLQDSDDDDDEDDDDDDEDDNDDNEDDLQTSGPRGGYLTDEDVLMSDAGSGEGDSTIPPPPGPRSQYRWTQWGWWHQATTVGLPKRDGTIQEPLYVIKARWDTIRTARAALALLEENEKSGVTDGEETGA